MAKKKINAGDLIAKIEKIAKSRMASGEVVELQNFRDLKQKTDPKVILVIEDDETMRKAKRKERTRKGGRLLLPTTTSS